tara:strand:+ start:12982 stop:13299 length:318 start_codon:yes stop_codon:yes gene_type:complete
MEPFSHAPRRVQAPRALPLLDAWHRGLLEALLLDLDGSSIQRVAHELQTMRSAVRERAAYLEAHGLLACSTLTLTLTAKGRAAAEAIHAEEIVREEIAADGGGAR